MAVNPASAVDAASVESHAERIGRIGRPIGETVCGGSAHVHVEAVGVERQTAVERLHGAVDEPVVEYGRRVQRSRRIAVLVLQHKGRIAFRAGVAVDNDALLGSAAYPVVELVDPQLRIVGSLPLPRIEIAYPRRGVGLVCRLDGRAVGRGRVADERKRDGGSV